MGVLCGTSRGSLRESPWLRADHLFCTSQHRCMTKNMRAPTYLSFTVGPEIDSQTNHLVDGCICALIQERSGEGAEREEGEAGFEAAVKTGPGEEAQRPLPCEEDESKHQVDGLENRYRFDGRIERLCGEVPKYLGPEVPRHRGSDLVCMAVSISFPVTALTRSPTSC